MAERDDLLAALTTHRALFLVTTRELSDEQARSSPTRSTLSIGGLVKHVAATERMWADFLVRGAVAMSGPFDPVARRRRTTMSGG